MVGFPKYSHICILTPACILKILLSSAFKVQVDLSILYPSPGAAEEFMIVWCVHIHDVLCMHTIPLMSMLTVTQTYLTSRT